MSDSVRAYAPASVGNVGCGFDVLGLAIEKPGDIATVTRSAEPGAHIVSIDGDAGRLPRDVAKNTASVAVGALLSHVGGDAGVDIALEKRMPLGSGLGSSAASAVAAVVAANEMLGGPLERRQLLPFCVAAERVASGAPHADNVAPSLLGGLVLVRAVEPVDVVRIEAPPELWCVVVHPHFEIRTKDARRVLPEAVTLTEATQQWANVGALVAAFAQSDYALIGRALEDVIVERHRAPLIPGFTMARRVALEAGALGFGISGSGPSVFALARGEKNARAAGSAIAGEFARDGNVESTPYVSKVNMDGAVVID